MIYDTSYIVLHSEIPSFFLDRAAASFTAGGDIGGDGGGGGGAQGEGGALPRHREGLRPRRL